MTSPGGLVAAGPQVLAGLLAVAALAGCGGSGVTGGADDSHAETVPSVVGLTVREAEAALFRASLRWRYEGSNLARSTPLDENAHTSQDDATIERQAPAAGTAVEPGTVVLLAIPDCKPPPGAGCV